MLREICQECNRLWREYSEVAHKSFRLEERLRHAGDDLQALSDDPNELQEDLQPLAGPSAGPSGGAIFIDGFSGGDLPAKNSIREIRINQNPFSPEYDKLGYGRIEVLQ